MVYSGPVEPITETSLTTGNMSTRASKPVPTALLYNRLTCFYNNTIFMLCTMHKFFVKAYWSMNSSVN